MNAPRKPQDHKPKKTDTPDSTEIPATFTHTVGDTEVTVPSLDSLLTMGMVRKTRHMSDINAMFFVLEENVDEETLGVLDTMRTSEMEGFFEAWREHSGITVGESEASSS